MKKILTLILLNICTFSVTKGQESQVYQVELREGEKFEKILPPQQVYINSATKIGGKTRVYFPITFPENTVRWFYIITTTKGEGEGKELNVLAQLTTAAVTGGGSALIKGGTQMISIPSSSGGVVDTYLLDRNNLDIFTNKGDNWGQDLYYNIEGTRENFKNGVVMINELLPQYTYIGIKNPSSSLGVNVKIEAIAIVGEKGNWEISHNKEVKETFKRIIERIIPIEYQGKASTELSECAYKKVTSEKNINEVINFAKSNLDMFNSYLSKKINECINELKQVTTSCSGNNKSRMLNNLALGFMEQGDFQKAEENLVKAIDADKNNALAKCNLALIKLYNGDNDIATNLYIEAVDLFKKDMLEGKIKFTEEYNKLTNFINNNLSVLENINDFKMIANMLHNEIQNIE